MCLGPEHPDTLASLNELAASFQTQQRYGEAEPLMLRGLDVSERVLGPEHPDTLLCVVRLSALYLAQDRHAEAEPFLKRTVEIQQHVMGGEHPSTLISMKNLADVYRLQDRFREATPLYQRILEVRERTLGRDAPETIESVSNLAAAYKGEGRPNEAEPLFTRALETRERVLGRDAPETIESVNNLAELYQAQGRYGEAEPLFRRALETRERLLGQEHRDTLVSVDNLARQYQYQSQFAEAELLMRRSRDIRERALGKEHPDTLRSITRLADLYLAQDQYSAAEPLYKYALEARQRVLGDAHVDTVRSVVDLAKLFLAQNRDSEAEPLLRGALETSEQERGKEHLETLAAVNNLAALYVKQGRFDEAEPLFRRAAEAFERVRGNEHPQTLASLDSLALVYTLRGRYDEAELLAKRGLEVTERVLGREHPDTILRLGNLASIYHQQGRAGEAEPLYQRALDTSKRVYSVEDQDTVMIINNLANAYAVQGRYDKAEPLLRSALKITEHIPDGQNIGVLLTNLALVRFAQRDWAEAAQLWRRSAVAIIRRAQRGAQDAGQGLTGRKHSEVEQWRIQFSDLIKAIYRLKVKGSAPARETFQTAQWALSSEAARSLAQMAARGARGDPELAGSGARAAGSGGGMADTRQLEQCRAGQSTGQAQCSGEAENRERLAAIDTRIATIDKKLAAEFPDYAALASPVPLSVGEVQAQLGEDEALVLFLDTQAEKPAPEETFIWVVTKTKLRWVRSDLGTAALTREVQALRCGLDEEEWGTVTTARRCGDLLGLTDMPDASRPLPFSLSKAYALYKALFGQIEDMIAGKRLLIVPSGVLTSLPFQVLVTKKPKIGLPKTFEAYRDIAWLGRRSPIAILPAVSSLKALRQHAADRRPGTDAYAGFGNPLLSGDVASCRSANTPAACPGVGDARRPISRSVIERATVRGNGGTRNVSANMDQVFANGSTPVALLGQVRGLCPLADTAYEINCVAARFKGRSPLIRLAGEATEANIKALSLSGQLARYRVLHLATHGLLSGDVEKMAQRQGEPALVLTPPDNPADDGDDGLLMASEVAALKLNADWVVLSACNTAAGDQIGAQALSGLARAFFYAGGRALLVSHWPVYSDAAVRLTINAFAELERHPNEGRAEALQKSMTALMDDRSQADNAHPAVWAPFIVVGEGGGDVSPRRQPRGKK